MKTKFVSSKKSAGLNMISAGLDLETAKGYFVNDKRKDCLLYLSEAISQLQSAQAKLRKSK